MASWTRKAATKIWDPEPNARAKELEDNVKGNLRRMSESLADQEDLKRVEIRHINIAFEALAKIGLMRRRLVDRPDVFMAAGGFFIGAAWACPDAIALFFDSKEKADSVSLGVMSAAFFFGVLLCIFALYLSKQPPVVSEKVGRLTQLRRAAVWFVGLLMLAAIGSLFWAKFIGCPNCGALVPIPAGGGEQAPDLAE